MKLLQEILTDFKKMIIEPAKAFEASEKKPLKYSLIYALFGMIIFGALSAIVSALSQNGNSPLNEFGFGPAQIFLLMFVIVAIGGFFGILLGGLWMHFWAYVFGARQGLVQTIKIAAHARTPVYLFEWIPLVGILASIWSTILFGLGLMKLQKMSFGRAAGVIIVGIVIPGIILGLIFLFVVMSIISSGEELVAF